MPEIETILTELNRLHPLAGLVLVGAGGLFLAMGWKIFKVLIVGNAAAAGAMAGAFLGQKLTTPNMDIILAVVGGVLLAALAWPTIKWAVSIMGGLAGAAVGWSSWYYVTSAVGATDLAEHQEVGALIGLIVLALLAFLIFKTVIIFFTSFQGAIMVAAGAMSLMTHSAELRTWLTNTLTANSYLLPIIVLLPGCFGAIMQGSSLQAVLNKKKKAAASKS